MPRELLHLMTPSPFTPRAAKHRTVEETCAACGGAAWSIDTGEECDVCNGRGLVTVRVPKK